MQQYSARFIGSDGQIMQRIDLLCADEADAHQQATQLATGDTVVELWRRDQLVATYVPYLRVLLH
jgi:hypothetical protein